MLHQNPFIKNIENTLRAECLVQPGHRLLLAVSGGADSIALTRALHCIANRSHWRLELSIMHVNHHLRPGADRDELFTCELASKLKIPCCVRHIHPDQLTGNLEANARNMRRAHFALAQKQEDYDGVLLAHHADDQLETLLMRLIRGAGPAAMGAMPYRKTHPQVPLIGLAEVLPTEYKQAPLTLLRPLLSSTHAQVIQFLTEIDQRWCEDETNQDTDYTRAKLRHEVLPILKSINPDASHKAMETAQNLQRLTGWLNDRTVITYQSLAVAENHRITLERQPLRPLPDIERIELLRHALIKLHVATDQVSRRVFEDMNAAIVSPSGERRVYQLASNTTVEVTAQGVIISVQPATRL